MGFKVLVICPESNEKDPRTSTWIEEGSLELIRIPIESVKNLSPLCDWENFHKRGLKKFDEIKEFSPDLVINPDWHTIDLAITIKETLNIPLISQFFRIFSYFKNYIPNEENYGIVKQKEIRLVSRSDLVITLSHFDQEWAQKNGAIDSRIIYPPLSEEFIQSLSASSNFNPSNSIRFITVSRVVPEKNMLRIFPILKELNKLGLDFSYTLIGEALDDEYKKEINQSIDSMNLQSNIHLLGRISLEEMIEQLRNHQIYIHTSSYEPFGITITEAASAGCTIVLDRDGLIGGKEFLLQYHELSKTILIDFSNPKFSAIKIHNLIEDFQPKEQNSINSELISKLSPTQYVENLVKIFRDFL